MNENTLVTLEKLFPAPRDQVIAEFFAASVNSNLLLTLVENRFGHLDIKDSQLRPLFELLRQCQTYAMTVHAVLSAKIQTPEDHDPFPNIVTTIQEAISLIRTFLTGANLSLELGGSQDLPFEVFLEIVAGLSEVNTQIASLLEQNADITAE